MGVLIFLGDMTMMGVLNFLLNFPFRRHDNDGCPDPPLVSPTKMDVLILWVS